VSLFCFDMDGTILDSMPTLAENAAKTIAHFYDVPLPMAEEMYHSTVGRPFAHQVELLFPSHPCNKEVVRVYESLHVSSCPTFKIAPGFRKAMELIHDRGHVTALVTSSNYLLLTLLPQVTILGFDYLGGHQPRFGKEQQMRVAKQFWPTRDVQMFGDTVYDEECAKIVGATFHLVTIETTSAKVREVLETVR
jgi:phosphoglycolate phosphatase-like HAD superfamily hydrolase